MGWKLISADTNQIRYTGKEGNIRTIVVISNVHDETKGSVWSVSITEDDIANDYKGKEIAYRIFDTKQEALSFAKGYMREN